MLDLARLRVLAALAEHGTVTAAAEALHYAQPSVSHHLARLEAETGAVLIQHVGRGVRLTEAGALLASRAAEILGRVSAAETELAELTGLRAGRVRLAAFPSALGTLVPAAAAQLQAKHPGLMLELTEAEPPEAVQLLRTGQVDAAVLFRHVPDQLGGTELRLATLLWDRLELVGPAGTNWSAALSAHADADWIAGCVRCREHLLSLCAEQGFEPRIRFTTDDYVAAQALVAAGLGMTVLPVLALDGHRHPGVRTEPLPGASREVVLARYGRPPDPPAVLAVAAALDAAASSGSWAAPTSPASPPSVAGRTRRSAR